MMCFYLYIKYFKIVKYNYLFIIILAKNIKFNISIIVLKILKYTYTYIWNT